MDQRWGHVQTHFKTNLENGPKKGAGSSGMYSVNSKKLIFSQKLNYRIVLSSCAIMGLK